MPTPPSSHHPRPAPGPQRATGKPSHTAAVHQCCVGQLLVSHPHDHAQNPLHHSVIMITQHAPTGEAVGLQINDDFKHFTVMQLASAMGIELDLEKFNLNTVPLYYGGAARPHRAQVLHTRDWSSVTTRVLTDELAVTSDISILSALVSGQGPRQFRICMGVWMWANLDEALTMASHSTGVRWLQLPATAPRVFDPAADQQWRLCLDQAIKHTVHQWTARVQDQLG